MYMMKYIYIYISTKILVCVSSVTSKMLFGWFFPTKNLHSPFLSDDFCSRFLKVPQYAGIRLDELCLGSDDVVFSPGFFRVRPMEMVYGVSKTLAFCVLCCVSLPQKHIQEFLTPDFWKAYGMFPKMVGFPPKSSHFNRVFHYKPSILGYHYFSETPI